MPIKILGISGSPVKKGNVETFLAKICKDVAAGDVQYEIINLSTLDIKDCIHCNFCIKKQKPSKLCSINDDAQKVFDKIEASDIIVLASPVYIMRTSARLAALLDRMRVFIFGNIAGGKLKNKIGVSAAVAWARHGGLETTHLSHLLAFLTFEMIPVSAHSGISPLGASAVSSVHGSGEFDPNFRLGIEQDEAGLLSAGATMKRAVELSRLVKKGTETLA